MILVRHGETEWSRSGRHTGRTDLSLTPIGEEQAVAAGAILDRILDSARPLVVISSPRERAVRTAELAGFSPTFVTEDAAEWDYGNYEGLTTAQIHERDPSWSVFSEPSPGGEDDGAVTARIDRLLTVVRDYNAAGPVLVFTHGHASRAIAARWLGLPVTSGRYFALGTGAVCTLGYEHDLPVILRWNLDSELVFGTNGAHGVQEDSQSAR
jgi:broad specificity phosphatase PhoE